MTAYDAGRNACRADVPAWANPYERTSDEAQQWWDGWCDEVQAQIQEARQESTDAETTVQRAGAELREAHEAICEYSDARKAFNDGLMTLHRGYTAEHGKALDRLSAAQDRLEAIATIVRWAGG